MKGTGSNASFPSHINNANMRRAGFGSVMGSSSVGKMEGPYSARLPSRTIGEKSRRAPAGRGTVDDRAISPYAPSLSISELMQDKASGGSFDHLPVMATEVIDTFEPVPAGTVVDATLGGGGHAAAILESRSDLCLVGIDQDPAAIAAASERLSEYGDRVRVVRSRFDRIGQVLDDLEVDDLVGALFDLGVSSPQFDVAERGFSYRNDGPLDMRMDTDQGLSADHLVNEASGAELARILRNFGDERFASRIADAIVANRPVRGTAELSEIVRAAIPAATRRKGGHPAKRTFQALRIAVNQELDVIEPALIQTIDHLIPGGRGAVLTYHSGEDRITKNVLRDNEVRDDSPRGLPVAGAMTGSISLIKRNGAKPSASEIETNPRAASARLRVFEKVAVAA